MTITELPPLPLEWQYEGDRFILWKLCTPDYVVGSLVLEDGYILIRINTWHTNGKFVELKQRFRSIDKAKAAAETAAQAEWKRFVAQLYTPKS